MVKLGYDGEMSVITDGIYVSRYRACRDREFLKQHNITHVINCASQSCENHFPSDFVYLNLPLKDEPLTEEQLHLPLTPLENVIPYAALFIQNCLDSGGRVVVHCRKGVSRSVAVVAGFLMVERGASLVQALTLIRERRKVADPNVWFVENLKEYQFKLQLERMQWLRTGQPSLPLPASAPAAALLPPSPEQVEPAGASHELSQHEKQLTELLLSTSSPVPAVTAQQGQGQQQQLLQQEPELHRGKCETHDNSISNGGNGSSVQPGAPAPGAASPTAKASPAAVPGSLSAPAAAPSPKPQPAVGVAAHPGPLLPLPSSSLTMHL
jgi:protein-tyrosine phosphatase